MYQVLIADDDRHIRERLKKGINWAGLQLALCDEAADGEEAILLFKQHLPNIVIIDIYMPNRSGLDVAREILGTDQDTIVICITGFNDFEYAQTAVKLGVFDFLLKPLDLNEVENILKKAVSQLDSLRQEKQNIDKLKTLVAESLPLLQQTFLQGLFDSAFSQEQDILKRLDYLRIKIRARNYVVAVMSPRLANYSHEEIDLKLMALSQTSQELIQAAGLNCISAIDSFNNTILLLSWDKLPPGSSIDALFSRIRNKLLFYFNFNLYIGIGGIVHQLIDVGKSREEAIEALEYRHMFAQNNIVNIKNVIRILNKSFVSTSQDKALIIGCFKDGNLELLSQRLNGLVANLASSVPGNIDFLKRTFIELTVLIIHLAADSGVQLRAVLPDNDPYRQIWATDQVSEIIEWFLNLSAKLIRAVEEKKGRQMNRIIVLAISYIHEQLTNPDLGLEAVSDHVGLSSVYFSQLFHSETNEKLTSYINRQRIEHAKDLLQSSMYKIYEIAEKSGYNNPKYFSYCFKKQTGLSPNEYRMQNIGIVT